MQVQPRNVNLERRMILIEPPTLQKRQNALMDVRLVTTAQDIE